MEDQEMTILEMYDVRAFIFGFQSPTFFCTGFINEKNPDLKESTKRKVAKVGKAVNALLVDIEEQREKIKIFVPEGFPVLVTEELSPEEATQAQATLDAQLAKIRKEKDDELLNSKEKITFEKPLFSLVADLSFPNNYTFLYDKIFKD